jgi:hypothetical protein
MMARPRGRWKQGWAEVRVAYGAIPNVNTDRGGFCPVYWTKVTEPDGSTSRAHQHGHTFCRGYDREDACRIARTDAHEAASRYAGDWDIRITERCASGSKRKPRR